MSDSPVQLKAQPTQPNVSNVAMIPLNGAEPSTTSATVVNQPNAPLIRFPPFPPVPPGVKITPFKQFKEHGIQIFSDTGVEIDGLGIPTVRLRVPHDTDVCKTQTKRKKTKEGEEGDEEGEQDGNVTAKKKGKGKKGAEEILDPVARAQEQRRQRLLLFAKKEWYEQWAEGEDLRGTKTYDRNLSPIDRIHIASTEFRTGRIWPPGHMGVNYLWDQFRLYAGLLGSPPVWTRTDIPQPEDQEDENDDETDSDLASAAPKKPATSTKKTTIDSDDDESSFARYSDEDEDEAPRPKSKSRSKSQDDVSAEQPTQSKPKRIPPRTPYALYNIDPIPVSSDAHVRKLLALALARRESKLLRFLSDVDHSTRVFLSWYLRYEGLVWTPSHLVSLPHLLSFFLSFLLRVRALPESERGLRRAIDVAKRAVQELPRTAKLCRLLPDKMGAGARSVWGARWEVEAWNFGWDFGNGDDGKVDDKKDAAEEKEETPEEAMKRFEEELKAANVQLLPADPADLGMPSSDLADVPVEGEVMEADIVIDKGDATETEIRIEVMSPTSPGYTSDLEASNFQNLDGIGDGGNAFIEEIDVFEAEIETRNLHQSASVKPVAQKGAQTETTPVPATSSSTAEVEPQQPKAESEPVHTADKPNWAAAPSPPPPPPAAKTDNDEDPSSYPFDWSNPAGPSKPTAADRQAARDAWAPPTDQPLMELFGMTVFPLKYEAGGRGIPGKGVAERSMRKVKAVFKPGEGEKDRKWRGVEEDLVKTLSRVVLTPWTDWDDGGSAPDYRVPKVQGPLPKRASSSPLAGAAGAEGKQEQDPEQDRLDRYAARYAHDPYKDDITLLMEPRVAELIHLGMGMAGTWVQLVPIRDESSGDGGRGRGRGRGRGGRGGGRGRGTGRGSSAAGGPTSHEGDTQAVDGDASGKASGNAVPAAPANSAETEGDLGSESGRGTSRGRGRGRGRGGSSNTGPAGGSSGGSTQKEFTFWYVEDIYMVVPSFWTVGEEEGPLDLGDLEDDFEI
ncbi:hypothetical protein BDZ97DRAFT_1850031 [Flammula alnicola]|nr:hypothetical protein BDZ97DRAFT_1850031 [Flammula alnicola]